MSNLKSKCTQQLFCRLGVSDLRTIADPRHPWIARIWKKKKQTRTKNGQKPRENEVMVSCRNWLKKSLETEPILNALFNYWRLVHVLTSCFFKQRQAQIIISFHIWFMTPKIVARYIEVQMQFLKRNWLKHKLFACDDQNNFTSWYWPGGTPRKSR